MRNTWMWGLVSVIGLGLLFGVPIGKAEEGKGKKKEEKVTIDQVPPAVKATILREAGGNKIEEIEKETKDGKTVYEAEWKADGKEIELTVAEDGTVLKKKVEEGDKDEDDDKDEDKKDEK